MSEKSQGNTTGQTPLPHPLPALDDIGPLVGRTFGGYEIASYIGEGPTGAVYRGEDLVGNRMAVKVMHAELSSPAAAERLVADLAKLSSLSSPHLARVVDHGFGEDGLFYLVSDELVGSDLETALADAGALTPAKALEIVLAVASALEAAHAVGVVHGGVKPRNIFLCAGPGGRPVVKLLDFGCSRLAGGPEWSGSGVVVGNPAYLAPEQFEVGAAVDARTDVYALGVIMYELFSGQLPFVGAAGTLMMRHLNELPAPPPGVDGELSSIILRALAKAPAARFPTVAALKQALERWKRTAPAILSNPLAYQVIARAAEANALRREALSAPDATTQIPKPSLQELQELAHKPEKAGTGKEYRQMVSPPTSRDRSSAPRPGVKDKNGASDDSASVEASLEDFISQANASFPTAEAGGINDGWDLHTGDVELLDDDEGVEGEEHVKAPVVVRPRAVAQAADKAGQKPVTAGPSRQTQRGIPTVNAAPVAPAQDTVVEPAPSRATAAEPLVASAPAPVAAPAPAPVAASAPVAAPAPRKTAQQAAVAAPIPSLADELEGEPEALDPPPAVAPRRRSAAQPVVADRSSEYSAPVAAPVAVPWTANPLVIIGGILAAFIIGATLVFFMVRTMVPQQPVVVQTPAAPPQIVVQPAAPVVTPLPSTAPAAAPAPTAPAPVAAAAPAPAPAHAPVAAPVVTPLPTAAPVPTPAATPVEKPAAPAAKRAPSKKATAAPAKPAAEKPTAAEKPAAEKPARKSEKSESKGGGDWVDPF
jgi:serine/threonine-protein kinase